MTIAPIQSRATMEEAWIEHDRLDAERHQLWEEQSGSWPKRDASLEEYYRGMVEKECREAEYDRLSTRSRLVVIVTALTLHGKDVQIDWIKRTVQPLTRVRERIHE